MSQFLSRQLSKLSSRNNAPRMMISRLFSSSSLTLDSTVVKKYFPPYFVLGKHHDKDHIKFWCVLDEYNDLEKKAPFELLEGKGLIGASQGWVATRKKGSVRVCLQDDLNLWASESNPKRISLPPLVTLPNCQTKIVTNMAMSSSSPAEDEDCIVAIKFLGPQLSLIRPARDSKWTNIKITNPSFFTSHVIYSQRHEMFSMPASGGCQIGYWDLHDYREKPRLQKIEFQNVPRLRKKERELFDSCYKTEHLVESSTGDTFLIMWYRSFHDGTHANTDPEPRELETKGFRVFKLDERGNASYTKDIGDLCIFISKAEAFCVPASSYCAPDKNFITYIDVHECIPDLELGSVDLDKADTHDMLDLITKIPYFFPPQLMQ